jgi:Protein of unknown function (DUF2442)
MFMLKRMILSAASPVSVDEQELSVDLADGRTITVPVGWFPRLASGSQAERANWRIVGGSLADHWRRAWYSLA